MSLHRRPVATPTRKGHLRPPTLALLIALVTGSSSIANAGAEWAAAPVAASPASSNAIATVESRCPTFIWGSVDGAESYEILVYETPAGSGLHKARPEELALAREFPGSVHGWVPTSSECLARGGRYAWTARAILAEGATEWSDPTVFEISRALSDVAAGPAASGRRRAATGEPRRQEPSRAIGSAPLERPAKSPRRRGSMPSSETAMPEAAAESQSSEPPSPELWVTLPAQAFQLYAGSEVVSGGARYCDSTDCGWEAAVDIPDGARIVGIELANCDHSSENDVQLTLFETPLGALLTPLHSVSTGVLAVPGCDYTTAALPSPHIADQFFRSYIVRVAIGLDALPCGLPPFFRTCPDSSVSLFAVRVYYEVNGEGLVEPTAQTTYSLFD